MFHIVKVKALNLVIYSIRKAFKISHNIIYTQKEMERIDMNGENEEIEYYKQMIHKQIDNMNDLNILKKIATFIFNISKWRMD